MNAISLKVNTQKLMLDLRHAFTNRSTTVLRELMQNARRAGATRVEFNSEADSLTVTDDGCGIADMSTLLSVSDSGWDMETVEREHPYGLGFLSALYAAEEIEVRSGKVGFKAKTRDILAFKPILIDSYSQSVAGASITLKGISKSVQELTQDITLDKAKHGFNVESLLKDARGFSIPVFCNGKAIERGDAQEAPGTNYVRCDAGWLQMTDHFGHRPVCYYQGLPVQEPYRTGYGTHRCVIHLDTNQFVARLPDRDTLVDAEAAGEKIEAAVRKTWGEHLAQEKQRLSARDFVAKHWGNCIGSGHRHLLNDVDCVPRELFSSVNPPQTATEYENKRFLDYPGIKEEYLTCEDIGRLGLKLVLLDDVVQDDCVGLEDEGFDTRTACMFAHLKGMTYVSTSDLDSQHWLFGVINDFTSKEWNIELVEEAENTEWNGNWTSGLVKFCKSYRIIDVVTGESVETETEALNSDSTALGTTRTVILYPSKCLSSDVLMQISNFCSDGNYEEHEEAQECTEFYRFVCLERADEPERVIKDILNDGLIDRMSVLKGRSFMLAVDSQGSIDVKEIKS